MNNDREKMDKALKEIVVPVLRDTGFTGSFPHFRRMKDGYIDLLSFQFDKYGGGFVVNLGKCTDKGIYCIGEVPPDKVTAIDVNDKRARLSPDIHKGSDYWFRYDKKIFIQNVYSKVAKEVVTLLKKPG